MQYLEDFRRMTKVSPSRLEEAAGLSRSMLEALSRAFSAKVKLEDIKYLRYRVYDDSVELKDQAQRFGGILTSVASDEVDLGTLVAFLRKHGARKERKQVAEASAAGKTLTYSLGGKSFSVRVPPLGEKAGEFIKGANFAVNKMMRSKPPEDSARREALRMLKRADRMPLSEFIAWLAEFEPELPASRLAMQIIRTGFAKAGLKKYSPEVGTMFPWNALKSKSPFWQGAVAAGVALGEAVSSAERQEHIRKAKAWVINQYVAKQTYGVRRKKFVRLGLLQRV